MRRDRLYSTDQLHTEAGLAKWQVRGRLASMRLMFKYKYKDGYLVQRVGSDLSRANYGETSQRFTTRPLVPYLLWVDRHVIDFLNRLPTISVVNGILCHSLRRLDDNVLFKFSIKRHYNTTDTNSNRETSILSDEGNRMAGH